MLCYKNNSSKQVNFNKVIGKIPSKMATKCILKLFLILLKLFM